MVDFALTDEHRLVQQSVRAFAEAEILPHIREWDEKGEVHREVFTRMGELGFLGAPIPEQYGGGGTDYISFALLCEELERADTAFRVVQSVHVVTTHSTAASGSGMASADAARVSTGNPAFRARGAAIRRSSSDGSRAYSLLTRGP